MNKNMPLKLWLELVASTLTRHGHRDNSMFEAAMLLALETLKGEPSNFPGLAAKIYEFLKIGTETYREGSPWFDSQTKDAYEHLLKCADNVEALNRVPAKGTPE